MYSVIITLFVYCMSFSIFLPLSLPTYLPPLLALPISQRYCSGTCLSADCHCYCSWFTSSCNVSVTYLAVSSLMWYFCSGRLWGGTERGNEETRLSQKPTAPPRVSAKGTSRCFHRVSPQLFTFDVDIYFCMDSLICNYFCRRFIIGL